MGSGQMRHSKKKTTEREIERYQEGEHRIQGGNNKVSKKALKYPS